MGKENQEYLLRKVLVTVHLSVQHIILLSDLIFFWKILCLIRIPGRTLVSHSLLSQPMGNHDGLVHQLLGYKTSSSGQLSFA